MRGSYHSALYRTSEDSVWCIQVASAYFIYDTYICVFRFAENGLPFLVHGILCCLAYMYPLVTHKMHYQGAAFLLWECSTPFLYMRWVFIKARGDVIGSRRKQVWQDRANVLFALAFFLCRIVGGPWQSWAFYRATVWDLGRGRGLAGQIPVGVVWGYRAAMVVLNGLNYFWFVSIVRVGDGSRWEGSDRGARESQEGRVMTAIREIQIVASASVTGGQCSVQTSPFQRTPNSEFHT